MFGQVADLLGARVRPQSGTFTHLLVTWEGVEQGNCCLCVSRHPVYVLSLRWGGASWGSNPHSHQMMCGQVACTNSADRPVRLPLAHALAGG